jgi:hypothetical protein
MKKSDSVLKLVSNKIFTSTMGIRNMVGYIQKFWRFLYIRIALYKAKISEI